MKRMICVLALSALSFQASAAKLFFSCKVKESLSSATVAPGLAAPGLAPDGTLQSEDREVMIDEEAGTVTLGSVVVPFNRAAKDSYVYAGQLSGGHLRISIAHKDGEVLAFYLPEGPGGTSSWTMKGACKRK